MIPQLIQLAWLSFGLLVGGLQIAAAVLLLRERHAGPWLMLAGAVTSLLGNTASHGLAIYGTTHGLFGASPSFPHLLSAVGAVSALGWLAFGIGLLLYACHRRALATHPQPAPSH